LRRLAQPRGDTVGDHAGLDPERHVGDHGDDGPGPDRHHPPHDRHDGRVTGRVDVAASRGVTLDPFQRDAFDAVDAGESVLVAAPTGSGKTLVAEYAIEAALARGEKAFYTTPLKALSNQKFT